MTTEPGIADSLVVDPIINEEKLRTLLDRQCEIQRMDYKESLDLSNHRDRLELAKDVAALRAHGGYIVIGADDNGRPSPRFTNELAAKFDEAKLRPALEKWLPPTGVTCARHTIDGQPYVLVYVPHHEDGFTVVHTDGQYDKPGEKKYPTVVLRRGDVFVRHGTSSERWNQADVPLVTAERDARLKEENRKDFAATVAAIEVGAQAQTISAGPAQGFTWRLDQATFDSTTVELLRRNDLVPIRLFLVRSPGDAKGAADTNDRDSFTVLLDRLIGVAATSLTVGRPDVAAQVVDGLHGLYNNPPQDAQGAMPRSVFWLEIASRIEALGGLAVILGDWDFVRGLVLRPPSGITDWYASWLRHGLTEAARANVYPTPDGRSPAGAMIPMARDHAHRIAALRPQAPDDSLHDSDGSPRPDDTVLDGICQFDSIAGLIVSAQPGKAPSTSEFYPGFGNYYPGRSEPVWVRIVVDPRVRAALFPGVDDETLRAAMQFVSEAAGRGDVNPHRLWGISDSTLSKFMFPQTN